MGEYLCVDIAGVQQEVFETCCHELFPLAQNRISFSWMPLCIDTFLYFITGYFVIAGQF